MNFVWTSTKKSSNEKSPEQTQRRLEETLVERSRKVIEGLVILYQGRMLRVVVQFGSFDCVKWLMECYYLFVSSTPQMRESPCVFVDNDLCGIVQYLGHYIHYRMKSTSDTVCCHHRTTEQRISVL